MPNNAADLYDADIVAWSDRQIALLRRLARGERVNDQVDWDNIIEEIKAMVRSEVRAVTGPLIRAMEHKLLLLGWPAVVAVRHWEHEIRIQLVRAHKRYARSMRREIEPQWHAHYREAVLLAEQHMLDAGPPATPFPETCPWALDELLAEGAAAMQPPAANAE